MINFRTSNLIYNIGKPSFDHLDLNFFLILIFFHDSRLDSAKHFTNKVVVIKKWKFCAEILEISKQMCVGAPSGASPNCGLRITVTKHFRTVVLSKLYYTMTNIVTVCRSDKSRIIAKEVKLSNHESITKLNIFIKL